MAFCNSHLKYVLDTNEKVAQIFQRMMKELFWFFFILWIKTALLSKFSLYILSVSQDKKTRFFGMVKSVLITY